MSVATHPLEGRLEIAGRWLQPCSGCHFESRNPHDSADVVGSFPTASPGDVRAAVAAAADAFPGWRRTSRVRRAELFDRLARLIDRDTTELARLMARECGKVVTECRAEVVEGLHMVQYVFGTGRMPTGEVLASEVADKDVSVRRRPRGVVAVITPWNFPFAVPLWMLAPSLLEGNTAVFKPSEETPAVGQRLAELFDEAGFPPGVLNLVHGSGEVGELLVRHPGVDVVLFTGSYDVGRRIQEISANFPGRVAACEMGGKNAVIVCADARPELAVTCAAISAFRTTGQRCVSASRILVEDSVVDEFCERFAATARRVKLGDPLDAGNFCGPLVNEAAVEKVLGYNALARREGADVLYDAGRLTGPAHARGCYVGPFVYRMAHDPAARCLREEVFGPHVAVIPFRTLEDAVRIHNDTEYGLSMAVVTEDYRAMRYLRDECEYGMGYVNLPCVGAEVHLPFGGVKRSGNGRPSAAAMAQAVTHAAAWTVNHAAGVTMAQGLSAEV